jgi:hypothetical protein
MGKRRRPVLQYASSDDDDDDDDANAAPAPAPRRPAAPEEEEWNGGEPGEKADADDDEEDDDEDGPVAVPVGDPVEVLGDEKQYAAFQYEGNVYKLVSRRPALFLCCAF